MKGPRFLILSSILFAVIFGAGNLLMQPLLSTVRIDFTQHGLYTLSDGTRQTLKNLAEPVDVTLVYSRTIGQDYPAIRAYAARVRELLDTYESTSGKQLRVKEINPAPFSSAEDEALAAGITAVETNGSDPLYFGLIGRNAVDDERVIPFLAPERETSLEYDLTRMIDRLDNPSRARIGILSSLPGMSARDSAAGYTLLENISKSFDVEQIALDFIELPKDLDVLLLAHPPELTERQAWLIDQYLLRSGRAVILVDPAAKTAVGNAFENGRMPRSDLGPFAQAWGVKLDTNAVADVESALPVPIENASGRVDILNHPLFPAPPATAMSQTDITTSDLARAINFGAPGALDASQLKEGLTFSSLVLTGPSPSFIDADMAAGNMTPADVLAAYKSQNAPLTIAGRLSGNLMSAFPSGPPVTPESTDPVIAQLTQAAASQDLPHIPVSETGAEIILIADVDMLYDDFYVIPDSGLVTADNGAFVLNALDALSGGGDLARLRSRAASRRPMTLIEDMRATAEAEYFTEQRELEERLVEAQARLEELQQIGLSDEFFSGDLEADLSDEQRTELSALRADIVVLRGSLRNIERAYRKDVDRVETTLKLINIWGGPLIVCLIGLLVWRREHKQAKAVS